MLNRTKRMYTRGEEQALSNAVDGYGLMKASRSGLMVSAWMTSLFAEQDLNIPYTVVIRFGQHPTRAVQYKFW